MLSPTTTLKEGYYEYQELVRRKQYGQIVKEISKSDQYLVVSYVCTIAVRLLTEAYDSPNIPTSCRRAEGGSTLNERKQNGKDVLCV
ncbi:MAG: hypothetical protein JRJ46_02000 [Deltaproteobacteria bacterium]|nr:hypothetical protein [Deltaproteobacteria bacterium]